MISARTVHFLWIDLREIQCNVCPNNAVESCEYCRTRPNESYTLIEGINEILLLFSVFLIQFRQNFIKEMSTKINVIVSLCGVDHLQLVLIQFVSVVSRTVIKRK
jgi:hypothetical protein